MSIDPSYRWASQISRLRFGMNQGLLRSYVHLGFHRALTISEALLLILIKVYHLREEVTSNLI